MSRNKHLHRCPSCAHPSFRRYGYVMRCDDCGWRSDTSCGADGFEIPLDDEEPLTNLA